MQEVIDKYYMECQIKGEPITITGLALFLGFNSRQALINYENYSDEFHDTIKTAKLRVENAYEKRLVARGNGGDIFALKQFDWSDKQDINHGGQKDNPLTIVSEADKAIMERFLTLQRSSNELRQTDESMGTGQSLGDPESEGHRNQPD